MNTDIGPRILGAILFASMITLSGCYGPITRFDDSLSLQAQKVPEPLTQSAVPLVVVRWPSEVTSDVRAELIQQLDDYSIWGTDVKQCTPGVCNVRQGKDTLDETIAKSAFHAAELYALVKKGLPNGAVVMQGGVLSRGRDGHVNLTFPHGIVKGVIYVDFVAYVDTAAWYERTGGLLSGDWTIPSTFGPYFTPLLSVHAELIGAPQTSGALAGIRELPPLIERHHDHGGARASFWSYAGENDDG